MPKETTKTAKKDTILYTKGQLVTFKRYAEKTDILKVILDDGKKYSYQQVDDLIQKFLREKVD